MRHVAGFFVGLILAPVVLLGTGWALPRLIETNGSGGTFVSTTGLIPVAALGAVALLAGLALVPPRLTPLLPGVAGLGLIAVTAVEVVRPDLVERLPDLPGLEGALTLTGLGVYLPAAVVLLLPLFVPSRWRSRDEGGPVTEEDYFNGLYDEDYEDEGRQARSPRGGHRRV
ncbi:MAG: hypothetical protein M0026_09045 [Nocardiopsaceae bacterium]|nr:hypothetical protein [Nocardiopsaceae bacterium]